MAYYPLYTINFFCSIFYSKILRYIILALASQALSQCPYAEDFEPCTCDGEGFNCNRAFDHNDLVISFKSFSEIKMARALFMQGTNVHTLTTGIFGTYAIQSLFLDFNNITRVETGAFQGSEDLATTISLYQNNVKQFPFQDIKKLTKLEILNLGQNELTTIPENAFESSSLTQLILANNKISYIGSRAFELLSTLQSLELTGNRIKSLGQNTMALTSKYVELTVSLSFNNVQMIDPDAFSGIAPKYFLLNKNNITTVPKEYYSNLLSKMLDIGGFISFESNLMSCEGCSFEWLLGNDGAAEVFAGFKCVDGTEIEEFVLLDRIPKCNLARGF